MQVPRSRIGPVRLLDEVHDETLDRVERPPAQASSRLLWMMLRSEVTRHSGSCQPEAPEAGPDARTWDQAVNRPPATAQR
jgi:hypothetical protein